MSATVYSTPSCPYCTMVKNYLNEQGVKYTDYDVSKDRRKGEEMVRLSGQMGVPVVKLNGRVIVGFNKGEIDRILNAN